VSDTLQILPIQSAKPMEPAQNADYGEDECKRMEFVKSVPVELDVDHGAICAGGQVSFVLATGAIFFI
jgi:hypothetical protein